MAPTHDCPGGCGQQIPQRHLACKWDWYRLPTDIRTAVWNGYRLQRWGPEHSAALADALDWYAANPRQEATR
jgi:hypothetical protein